MMNKIFAAIVCACLCAASARAQLFNFYTFAGSAGQGSANGLNIAWASLLQNGTEIDRDTHTGIAQSATEQADTTAGTTYVLHLPARKAGATYQIEASVEGSGGTNTSGIVYLPNWN